MIKEQIQQDEGNERAVAAGLSSVPKTSWVGGTQQFLPVINTWRATNAFSSVQLATLVHY